MMMKVTNIYKHEIVDTRASILDPCIQGILYNIFGLKVKVMLLHLQTKLEDNLV